MVGVYTVQVTMSNVYTNTVGGLASMVSGSPFTVDIFEPSLTGDIPDSEYIIDDPASILPSSYDYQGSSACTKAVIV